MTLRTRLIAPSAFLIAAFSVAAHADTYQYSYSAPAVGQAIPAATLTFDETSILTSETTIEAVDFLSMTGGPVKAFEINPAIGDCLADTSNQPSCIAVEFSSGQDVVTFTAISLDTTGIFNVGSGTLSITDLTPSSVTPEPSSMVLLGTGILGLAGAARRRLRK